MEPGERNAYISSPAKVLEFERTDIGEEKAG